MSLQGPATLARSLSKEVHQTIEINLNVKQVEHVNALYRTGMWGSTPAETVRRMFDAGLRKHLKKLDTKDVDGSNGSSP